MFQSCHRTKLRAFLFAGWHWHEYIASATAGNYLLTCTAATPVLVLM